MIRHTPPLLFSSFEKKGFLFASKYVSNCIYLGILCIFLLEDFQPYNFIEGAKKGKTMCLQPAAALLPSFGREGVQGTLQHFIIFSLSSHLPHVHVVSLYQRQRDKLF